MPPVLYSIETFYWEEEFIPVIKAVFFDIDGTLLSHASGGVPESARKALALLERRGIRRFLATGRHILEIRRLLPDLSFDGYVTLNGQICLDGRQRLLFDAPFPPEDARQAVSIFRQKEIPAMLVQRDRMYISFIDSGVRLAQAAISSPLPPVGTYAGGRIYQLIVYGGAGTAALLDRLPGCKMSRWNDHAVDILPRSGGKTLGIQQFLRRLSLDRSEIMAFGDGENDVDMLRYAGLGVAMGNADAAVRAAADCVTADVDQDGIYLALERCGLL